MGVRGKMQKKIKVCNEKEKNRTRDLKTEMGNN